jgi:hypothetical protein
VITYGGQTYLSFSAGTVDKYYSLGLMRAQEGADLTDPANWTVYGYPLLDSYDTGEGQVGGEAQAGPGHNSFVLDAAGNLALIYHARPYPDPHTTSGAGGLYDPDRNTAVKAVNVRADGNLDMSITADQEVAAQNRTVTATVVVRDKPTPPAPPSSPAKATSHTTVSVSGQQLAQAVKAARRHHTRKVAVVINIRVAQSSRAGVPTGVVRVRVGNIVRTVTLRAGTAALKVKLGRGRAYGISASYSGSSTVGGSTGAAQVRIKR